nr:glycoside hydrolase [Actinomycetota bacterium]
VHDGANSNYDGASGSPCGKNTENYCDDTLVKVEVPEGARAQLRIDVDNFRPNPASDFDLYVYESDAVGTRGRLIDNSGTFGVVFVGAGLPAGFPENYVLPAKAGYYLVRVVYWEVPIPSQYSGAAQISDVRARAPHPQDVDTPAGIQEYLASDPALGFKSQSEPHIAQSPTNPDILVAGSKRYDRDRDSLAEYEFKIGTYVSFDRGVTWTDLGQLRTCPPAESPPEQWPVRHTCYPAEDPTKGGTGPEDVKEGEDDAEFDDRGSGDRAEEYTTSDVWLQFDDEGNAYVMVLDHAPLDLEAIPGIDDIFTTNENGWGMTLHKWESVSPEDVRTGTTWGPRVPINAYPDESRQRLFLDDKNTMAVNNAGPDGDGKPGPIVACWGRTAVPAKQTIVCETSTDGGKSFPGEPVQVSEPQNLVIGVHVFPDLKAENTFHLIWNYYVATTSPYNQMYYSRTTDAGRTWLPPVPASPPFEGLPRQFPGQEFRNLSIPIGVVAPNGELYATWAEMREAPDPATDDGDGLQADVVFTKSTNGGNTWSTPTVVNQDKSNADQFQPYIAVTPQNEIQLAYFDRRHDTPVGTGSEQTHAGNYYVDEYLSRSTDGGAKWTDTRLSHDLGSPEHNAPVSTSGLFFGDYQGLVADDCFTIPFFQDAHLAEDATRDPEFDAGMPRSQYQEVFAWRVPNAKQGAGCTKPVVEGPAPPVTPEGLPRVSITAPRLASDASRSNAFSLRINATAANIDYYELQHRRLRSNRWRPLNEAQLAAIYRFRGSYSSTYAFRARAIALDGRQGPWSDQVETIIPHDDRRLEGRPRYAGRWARLKSRAAYGSAFSRTSRKGASMRIRYRGSRLYLVGRKSRYGGKALVIVNGKRKRISFYSSKTRNRRVVFSMKTSPRRRTHVQVIALGQRGSSKSKGTRVEIDGIGYRER